MGWIHVSPSIGIQVFATKNALTWREPSTRRNHSVTEAGAAVPGAMSTHTIAILITTNRPALSIATTATQPAGKRTATPDSLDSRHWTGRLSEWPYFATQEDGGGLTLKPVSTTTDHGASGPAWPSNSWLKHQSKLDLKWKSPSLQTLFPTQRRMRLGQAVLSIRAFTRRHWGLSMYALPRAASQSRAHWMPISSIWTLKWCISLSRRNPRRMTLISFWNGNEFLPRLLLRRGFSSWFLLYLYSGLRLLFMNGAIQASPEQKRFLLLTTKLVNRSSKTIIKSPFSGTSFDPYISHYLQRWEAIMTYRLSLVALK